MEEELKYKSICDLIISPIDGDIEKTFAIFEKELLDLINK